VQLINTILKKIPKPFKNKYIITIILFVIWILFLDDYNLVNQYKIKKKIETLKLQKSFYESEIKKDSTELYNLKNNPEAQEKFAREKFLMKKDNEDIFIIKDKNE
tara:strand:- start:4244 stop:4558 length:315 start_codon:yes stop_codon:yes gene_type:complete